MDFLFRFVPFLVYWSSEFKTPPNQPPLSDRRRDFGPGVQFRTPARSMVPDFEDEGALLPARKSSQICAKQVVKQLGAVQRRADVAGLPGSR